MLPIFPIEMHLMHLNLLEGTEDPVQTLSLHQEWANWVAATPPGSGEEREIAVEKLKNCEKNRALFLDLRELKLSSLPSLPPGVEEVDASYNALQFIPHMFPDSIKYIFLQHNFLTSLPQLPPDIKILDISHNKLINLSENIDRISIEFLYVNDNQLSILSNFPLQLKYVNASNNLIKNICPLVPTIEEAYFNNNLLTDLPIISSELTLINVDNNPLISPIPKIIHYIWLGKSILPLHARHNIIDCATKNSEYQVNLWVDHLEKMKSSLLDLGCSSNFFSKINIMPFELPPKIAAAFNRECVDTNYKNYAAASDILRLFILKEHGGLYMDVDVALNKPIDEIYSQSPTKIKDIDSLFYCNKINVNGSSDNILSNAVIACIKNSHDIKTILNAAISAYEENIEELGEQQLVGKGKLEQFLAKKRITLHELMWSKKRFEPINTRPANSYRGHGTVNATGPGLLASYFTGTIPGIEDDTSYLTLSATSKKLIADPDNFGQISTTPLRQWQKGLNDNASWVLTDAPLHARRTTL